jgi:hypothetical protein
MVFMNIIVCGAVVVDFMCGERVSTTLLTRIVFVSSLPQQK